MKKNVIILSLLILLVIGLLIMTTTVNNAVYTDIEGIKYAILVNGEPSNSFPSGNYKVDVECTNADAYWNSITSKVIIKNIKGNVSCDIEFTSITNNDYLNTYILGLLGTTQGEGQLIHETGLASDYTNTSVVTNYGTTPAYFVNAGSTSITQTNTGNYWTFNSSTGVFTSNPSTFMSGTSNYYHVYAKVPSEGFYQICYTIAQAPNYYNFLYCARNTTSICSISPSTSTQVGETCYDMGYFEATDYFNISERGYSGTSSPVMTFRIEKGNTIPVDAGYRYEGKNPNNYIMYNNELWKIIGVFETEYDTNNDGIADGTSNLVKIIRKNPIGGLAWNKSNTNDWPNSSLYHLLNEQYYDWETNKSNVGTYCYGYSTSVPIKCDYSNKGIQDGYRSMIVKAKWYLGGGGKTEYKIHNMYSYERNSNAIYTGRSASTLGYIGLMYASDYLYGVLASSCARTRLHNTYSNASCAGSNWLYEQGNSLTISPNSDNNKNVWRLYDNGNISYEYASVSSAVHPTLYLSENVYRVSGTGTITDPYIIGMATS